MKRITEKDNMESAIPAVESLLGLFNADTLDVKRAESEINHIRKNIHWIKELRKDEQNRTST